MIIAKEKNIFPEKHDENFIKVIILYYILTDAEYIVLGIYFVRSKGQSGRRKQRIKRKKETTQAIHQEPPKFQAKEGKSSQKFCMVLIIELLGLKY